MRVYRMIAITLAGVTVLAPAAACSSADAPAAGQAAQAATAPPATPTPVPTHPFTGLPGAARRPVLVAKIENTSPGKPQLGLKKADIVYIEQVEAGLTRLMAVFSSNPPAKIGPVRSARISDLHLMPQFGKPAFAYSGAQTKMLPFIAEASLYRRLRQPGAGRLLPPAGALRALQPVRQHQAICWRRRPRRRKEKDIGFTFGDAPEGGVPKKTFSVKYPGARFTFGWSETAGKWLIWQDGQKDMAAEGGQLGAPTIVVQYVKTERSEFHDLNDSYTPLMHTTGKGKAVVLRDGQAFKAEW